MSLFAAHTDLLNLLELFQDSVLHCCMLCLLTKRARLLAHAQDGNWSETGDRYLLKLFRDFVFHQTAPPGHEADGGPLMDWGHVVEALNKVCVCVLLAALCVNGCVRS